MFNWSCEPTIATTRLPYSICYHQLHRGRDDGYKYTNMNTRQIRALRYRNYMESITDRTNVSFFVDLIWLNADFNIYASLAPFIEWLETSYPSQDCTPTVLRPYDGRERSGGVFRWRVIFNGIVFDSLSDIKTEMIRFRYENIESALFNAFDMKVYDNERFLIPGKFAKGTGFPVFRMYRIHPDLLITSTESNSISVNTDYIPPEITFYNLSIDRLPPVNRVQSEAPDIELSQNSDCFGDSILNFPPMLFDDLEQTLFVVGGFYATNGSFSVFNHWSIFYSVDDNKRLWRWFLDIKYKRLKEIGESYLGFFRGSEITMRPPSEFYLSLAMNLESYSIPRCILYPTRSLEAFKQRQPRVIRESRETCGRGQFFITDIKHNYPAVWALITSRNQRVVIMESQMGTGKTRFLQQIVSRYNGSQYISSRKSLTNDVFHGYPRHLRCVNYLTASTIELEMAKHRIIQVESLKKLFNSIGRDLLILDEIEGILTQLTSLATNKNSLLQVWQTFRRMIYSAKKIIICDHFFTRRALQWIEDEVAPLLNTFHIKNVYSPINWTAAIYYNREMWLDEIKVAVHERKKFFVFCCWRRHADELYAMLSEMSYPDSTRKLRVERYCAVREDDRQDIGMRDLRREWAEADIIIYTTTILYGISYTNRNSRFDLGFVDVRPFPVTCTQMMQSLRRIRVLNDNKLHVFIPKKTGVSGKNITEPRLGTAKARNNAQQMSTLMNAQGMDQSFIGDFNQFRYDIGICHTFVNTKFIRDVSADYTELLLCTYMREAGITPVLPPDEEKTEPLKDRTLPANDYFNIDLISSVEYSFLKDSNTSSTADEKLQMKKYEFNLLLNVNVVENDMELKTRVMNRKKHQVTDLHYLWYNFDRNSGYFCRTHIYNIRYENDKRISSSKLRPGQQYQSKPKAIEYIAIMNIVKSLGLENSWTGEIKVIDMDIQEMIMILKEFNPKNTYEHGGHVASKVFKMLKKWNGCTITQVEKPRKTSCDVETYNRFYYLDLSDLTTDNQNQMFEAAKRVSCFGTFKLKCEFINLII